MPLTKWTCVVPPGMDVSTILLGAQVKAKCRDMAGVLTLTRIRAKRGDHGSQNKGEHKMNDHGQGGSSAGRVEVETRGSITAVVPNTTTGNMDVTVQPGPAGSTTLPAVQCSVTQRTHVFGTPTLGENVKMTCKSRDGVLVAKKIKEKGLMKPGQVQVEVKGPNGTVAPDNSSVTIGGVTCAVPAGSTLLTRVDLTMPVEAHCAGDPLSLVSIHNEN